LKAYISKSFLVDYFDSLCFDSRRAKKELDDFVQDLMSDKLIAAYQHGYAVIDADFNAFLGSLAQKRGVL